MEMFKTEHPDVEVSMKNFLYHIYPKSSGKAPRIAPLPAAEENQSFFDDDEPLKPPE